MCGENFRQCDFVSYQKGSPPHVRGKHPTQTTIQIGDGITPACAGKTIEDSATSSSDGDHPRMCGENLSKNHVIIYRQGSPPHVRGKLLCF